MPQIPVLDPSRYGTGVYRRRIRVGNTEAGTVAAELEDDYHHFRATVVHDGTRVVDVVGEAIRFPWATCPGAIGALRSLVGMPLSERCTAVGEHANLREQCTHLFDLAGLAVAHAAAGRSRRHYDITAPDRQGARSEASLDRDGERVVHWTVERGTVVAPERYAGRSLTGGFLKWAETTFGPEEAEALIVLRRGTMIANGRGADMDAVDNAIDMGTGMLGSCHTFTTGTAEHAARVRHSTLDFTDHADALLEGRGH